MHQQHCSIFELRRYERRVVARTHESDCLIAQLDGWICAEKAALWSGPVEALEHARWEVVVIYDIT